MGRVNKITIVVTGYVAAIVAGIAAAWLYNWRMARMPYDTSGGMYAGGEAMTSIAVFLLVALVPTLLALWYLRKSARFWNAVGVGALLFAGLGLIAVVVALTLGVDRNVALALFSLLGLAQLLGVPFWFGSFVLFFLIAPDRQSRRLLRLAIGIEAVIGLLAAIHWFVPMLRF